MKMSKKKKKFTDESIMVSGTLLSIENNMKGQKMFATIKSNL